MNQYDKFLLFGEKENNETIEMGEFVYHKSRKVQPSQVQLFVDQNLDWLKEAAHKRLGIDSSGVTRGKVIQVRY